MNIELNKLAESIYKANKEKGFWDSERNIGELLMLVVTELAEALEAHRKDDFAVTEKGKQEFDKSEFELKIKNTFEDEIADTFIRLFDLCGGLNIDIEKFIDLKLQYNKTRGHKHGKKY